MGKRNQKGAKGPTPHLRSRTTRSSKGRLVTPSTNPNFQLTSQLSLLGLYAAPTIGDGNCLFRALSDQVYGSPSRHAEVRKEVCDWIEKWGERYEGFVEFEDDEEGEEGGSGRGRDKGRDAAKGRDREKEKERKGKRLERYLRGMRENATYGGHMELSAFAHMTKRDIKVVQPGLVYVIEWQAGAQVDASASGSGSTGSGSTPSAEGELQSPRRRSLRTPAASASASTSSSASAFAPASGATAKEVRRVKTGRGYYVVEEVSSDEEEDDEEAGDGERVRDKEREEEEEGGGPTVYVAYHDWEHFSSIRNLRGPHSGLPNIKETPAETVGLEGGDNDDDVDPSMMQRDAAKERKKERERKEKERKERERKGRGLEREKEREKAKEQEKEKGVALKVKIKLPTPLSSTSSLSSISSSSSSVIGVDVVPPPAPMPIQPPQINSNGNGVNQDPTLIPLPTSRAASPFPSSYNAAAAVIQPPALLPTPLRESHTAELGGDDAAGSSSSMMTTTTTNSTSPEVVDAIPATTHITATATATATTAEAEAEATNTITNTDDLLSTPARGQYRSPKRTFDESSASGGEDPEGGRDRDGEGGRERRRRRVGSLVGTAEAGSAASLIGAAGAGGADCGTPPPPLLRSPGMNVDVDVVDADVDIDVVDVEMEMDADMPGLTTSSVGDSSSSSLSSSPLSSEAGSEVWSASASPAPEAEGEEVDMDPTTPVAPSKPHTKTSNPPSSMKKPKRFPHPYEAGGGGIEKQLTRRQRKALGLPKQRNVPPYLASGAKGASASAGKIVIPGGRWTGRSSSAAAIPGVADPSGVEEEWRRNGTGRVDVRGFRELKI